MVQTVLRKLIGRRAGQDRVALEEVAFPTVSGTTVARVLRDFVGPHPGHGPVEESMMLLGGWLVMEELRRSRRRQAEGKRSYGA